jgi:hypothetical protein
VADQGSSTSWLQGKANGRWTGELLFDRRATGGHGTLRLTLRDAGPPGLYPDPRAMLFLVVDEPFAEALDVAWRTAGAPLAGRCVTWRLTTDDLPCDEVTGGSLGAAFGVALADLARQAPPAVRMRRLDRRCAITAGLRPDLRLLPVTGVPNKLEEAVRQRLRVVLAPPADRETLPEPLLRDARVRFAADLPAAVRRRRTRVNPTFIAMVVALVLAAAGVTGGVLAAARESRTAHLRDIAAGLLPAAASLRTADPTNALLLEALAVRLDGPGARAALIRSLLANRYVGASPAPAGTALAAGARRGRRTARGSSPCGGRRCGRRRAGCRPCATTCCCGTPAGARSTAESSSPDR